jgi:mannose-6-phosphate isomerase-like protein (cupin superfamily)
MISAKRWGSTEVLTDTPFCEVHRIVVFPRQTCSRHIHEYKNNAFYVEEGTLVIWMEDGDEWAEVTLLRGDYLNVPPGVEHQFETRAHACIAFEIYYPDGCKPDIVRRKEDG